MWDLIVSVPDHSLSFYFVHNEFITTTTNYKSLNTNTKANFSTGNKDVNSTIYWYIFQNKARCTLWSFLP